MVFMTTSDGKTRAKKIIQNFVTENPEKQYLLDNFSDDLGEMGNISLKQKCFDTAQVAYDMACEIDEIITKAQPNNGKWLRRLSISYENCGDLARERGDAILAKTFFKKSITVMTDVKEQNKETRCELASLYGKLIYVSVITDDYEEFYNASTAAIKVLHLADNLDGISLDNRKFLTLLTAAISEEKSFG